MMNGNRKDLTGQRFGRLVVIEPVTIGKYRNSVWLCQCDCGNKKIVPTYRLLNGRTYSCGCYRKQAKQVIEELAEVKTENERLKAELQKYKDMEAKGLEEFKDIGGCWGCGIQLTLNQAWEDIKRLKAENEELKKQNEELDKMTGIFSYRLMEKYKKALEEVRDCINVLSTVDNGFKGSMVEWKINKIINEVLKDE